MMSAMGGKRTFTIGNYWHVAGVMMSASWRRNIMVGMVTMTVIVLLLPTLLGHRTPICHYVPTAYRAHSILVHSKARLLNAGLAPQQTKAVAQFFREQPDCCSITRATPTLLFPLAAHMGLGAYKVDLIFPEREAAGGHRLQTNIVDTCGRELDRSGFSGTYGFLRDLG